METDADRALVERCLRGDREAFTDLVVRYQRPIYNAAYWILRRPEDAGDVAQTVFLKVAERLDDYDPNQRFFSWIYRIAVNEALDVLRRNGHEEPLAEDAEFADGGKDPEALASDGELSVRVRRALTKLPVNDRAVLVLRHFSELSYQEIAEDAEFADGGKDPEALASDGELSVRVRRALTKLPVNDRAVLVLRHFSELSYQEIAEALDLDEKTVKSRLFEARQRMRALLNGPGRTST